MIDDAATSSVGTRDMQFRNARRIGLSSLLLELKHFSGQETISNWSCNNVCSCTEPVSEKTGVRFFLNLSLSICTQQPSIPRCKSHYSLQHCGGWQCAHYIVRARCHSSCGVKMDKLNLKRIALNFFAIKLKINFFESRSAHLRSVLQSAPSL